MPDADTTSRIAVDDPPSTLGAIHCRHLVKRFGSEISGVVALSDATFDVLPGEAVAVMGPSGSGKSTLLHLVGAMDVPTSGTVQVGDIAVHSLRGDDAARYRRKIGFVFQGFHLLGALSALDNVLAPLIPIRSAAGQEQRAIELLELVGLGDRFSSLPSELSGGQRQRVAIARALINDPGLILADEPTGSLDSKTGEGVVSLLLALREQLGVTLMLATHDQQLADRLGRTLRIIDGTTRE